MAITNPINSVRSTAVVSVTLLVATLAGIAAVVTGLIFGGGNVESEFIDPGALVRWGLPLSKFVAHLSMAVAIGALAFAAFALANKSPEHHKLLNLASLAAGFWSLFGLAIFVFTYANASGTAVSGDESFGAGLWLFATQIEMGQWLALNVVGAAILTILTLVFRGLTSTILLAGLGFASLVPLALIGHAAGSAGHAMAVNSMGMHLVAIVIWVGGLVALLFVQSTDSQQNQTFARRFSSLALVAFLLVAISGVGSASVRLTEFSDWLSPYGTLLLGKIAILVLLGCFGAWYRIREIRRIETGGTFWRIASVEVAIMAVAMGLATALAQTPLPEKAAPLEVTPAMILTGEPLPPEFTGLSLLTAWKIDIVWLVIAVGAIVLYLAGVRRLARRGDKWPIGRTISWVAGMLTLIYVTGGAINAYQEYLFSIHMIGHMILAMGIPVLLVPGAPVTLIMRAVEARKDGSRGVREWVLWAVHTRYAQFVSHPIVAAILFASSLVTFYYTPLFAWATSEHIGHQWMVVHFLITGYLFCQALVGIDPGPNRLAYPLRLLMLIGTMAFHAFFGLSLMDGSGLLLPEWFGAMGRTWGQSPLDDQHTGGAIAWGIGELPTAALTLMVSIQWFGADRRESRRLDRASDRTGNQDVEAYNQMLAKLAKRDQRDQSAQATQRDQNAGN